MKIIENGQGCNPVNYAVCFDEIDSVQPHFDGVGCLISTLPSRKDELLLRKHCHNLDIIQLKCHILLKLSVPDREVIKLLDRLGSIYYVEPALGIVLKSEEYLKKWSKLFGEKFVQRWHGKRHTYQFNETTYSANRSKRQRHNFVRYVGASKITGEPTHIKIEGRYQGIEACRSIGIEGPKDLINFDHKAYWERYLTLFDLDFERLGRSHQNKLKKLKNRTSQVRSFGGFRYNVDKCRGGRLYHALSFDPETEQRSLQTFIDRYGRGSWLHAMDVSEILDLIPILAQDGEYLSFPLGERGILSYEDSIAYNHI